jgi:isopropylmalate/homocitrate/citramalate synthase
MNLNNMPIKNEEFYAPECWAPPMNFDKELRDRFTLSESIYIHDVTLRDGEQTPGVAFSVDEKLWIAEELDEIGVQSIELGLPVISKDFKVMKSLSQKGLHAKLTCLVRAKKDDIDMAVEAGIRAVILEHSINPYTCKIAYGLDEDALVRKNVEMIAYAKKNGLWVNWMGWDTFRSDGNYIERVLKKVVNDGDPEAVTIADTFGMLHPIATFQFFKRMRGWFPAKLLEYHAHNDMGMATANALCAISGGANCVHSAVNSLGERAGNIGLEEIATVLKGCFHINTGIHLSKLYRLSKLVEQISRERLASNKPIVGDKLFKIESGLIMHIMMKAQEQGFPVTIMQPFLPEMVGQLGIEYVIGKGAGRATVEYFLKKLGITLSEDKVHRLIEFIKHEATLLKSCISIDEFEKGVNKV